MTDINVRDLIRSLPLKEMDGALLTAEIRERSRSLRVWTTTQNIDPYDYEVVDKAIEFAAYFHRNQRRRQRLDLPKDPYVNHSLRNALRLLRYGVIRSDIIAAAILHDTVEDCAEEIVVLGFPRGLLTPLVPQVSNPYALTVIRSEFGDNVRDMVSAVTNPVYPENASKAEKRTLYINHVSRAIREPEVWLVKFSDWVDNAAGLYHNVSDGGMIRHLTAKYLPLVEEFKRTFDSKVRALLPESGIAAITTHINQGQQSLLRLQESVK